jgi:hypothetical protein
VLRWPGFSRPSTAITLRFKPAGDDEKAFHVIAQMLRVMRALAEAGAETSSLSSTGESVTVAGESCDPGGTHEPASYWR